MAGPTAAQIERTVRAIVAAGLSVRSVRVTASGDILVDTESEGRDDGSSRSAYDLVDFGRR